MYTTLEEYCQSRLEEAGGKGKVRKVNTESLCRYLEEVSGCMDWLDLQWGGDFEVQDFRRSSTYTMSGLRKVMLEGVSLMQIPNASEDQKKEGQAKIQQAVDLGQPLACLLIGVHYLFDSQLQKDNDWGLVMLHYAKEFDYELRSPLQSLLEDEGGIMAASRILTQYYAKYPAPYMDLDKKTISQYAKCYAVEKGRIKEVQRAYQFINGVAGIGCIRICCQWFDKPIEVFVDSAGIDVYVAPYIPMWYIWHCIREKVGPDEMNEMATVCICNDGSDESYDVPPVSLRKEDLDGRSYLTQVILDGTYIFYPCADIYFEAKEVPDISWKKEGDDKWVITFPKGYDIEHIRIQRSLTRYFNNIFPQIAKDALPLWYENVQMAYNLSKGTCSVGSFSYENNDQGGCDITLPYDALRFPMQTVVGAFLAPFIDEDQDKETARWLSVQAKRYSQMFSDPMSTVCQNLKLLNKKRKKDFRFG